MTVPKYETVVCLYDIDFSVTYSIFGKNSPATQWEPAEYQEVEIEDIFIVGYDLYHILPENIVEKIYEKLLEELADEQDEQDEPEGDLYEEHRIWLNSNEV